MDIDPLWVIGGCNFRFLSSICMAKFTKTPSSSFLPSSSSSKQIYYHSKSHTFLTGISLVFVILLLVDPAHQARSLSNMVSEPAKQTLVASVSVSESSTTMSTTSSFQPNTKGKKHGDKLPSKQFEGDEHEVPSGPNPISNR
ncbi:hypothetical protein RND81_05G218300 [Saponaria officinalis]|uniref:Uncharacterized protein n=1 Tax=Saponaria officinalis TaxID=3572 RepID=A0AAW1KVM4_SAPOF